MGAVDPTKVRLSDSILLSDVVVCDSIFRYGHRNPVYDSDSVKIREGRYLMASLIEYLLEDYGPASFSYGLICPELSSKIVRCRDPKQPSYHRWDKGAAADVCFHDWVRQEGNAGAPIFLAHRIDADFGYSRMITYSESPYICLATRIDEGENHREAFYENRYTGQGKPKYIKKSSSLPARQQQGSSLVLEHDWQGQGYPSYHGGGRRQLHHIRLGRYSMLSDFLYSRDAVHYGRKNLPPFLNQKFLTVAAQAAKVLDRIVETTKRRMSVVRGYESPALPGAENDWKNRFSFEIAPPVGVSLDDVYDIAQIADEVADIRVSRNLHRVRITGKEVKHDTQQSSIPVRSRRKKTSPTTARRRSKHPLHIADDTRSKRRGSEEGARIA